MIYLEIRAKKHDGEFVNDIVSCDEKIYKIDEDSLYGFISDYLDDKYGNVFKWFRFEKLTNQTT